MRWTFRIYSYATVALCCSTSLPGEVRSQQKPRDVVIESNRQELDNLLLRKPILAREDPAARLAVLKQINDDFKTLQVLNNQVMSEVTAEGVINYKSIANKISQIGGKASRLRSNLLLPEVTVELKALEIILEASELKQELLAFDKIVMSFVHNPIFKKSGVIDVELAKEASNDLEVIIKRSSELKKAATTLDKK